MPAGRSPGYSDPKEHSPNFGTGMCRATGAKASSRQRTRSTGAKPPKWVKEYQFKLPRPDEVSGRTDEIGDTNLLGEVRFANTGGTRNMTPPATFAS